MTTTDKPEPEYVELAAAPEVEYAEPAEVEFVEEEQPRSGRLRFRRAYVAASLIVLLAILLVAGYSQRDQLGEWAKANTTLEQRHNLQAFWNQVQGETPETADMQPIAYNGMNPYGINVFLDQEVDERNKRLSLQLIKDAGFGWIKQQFAWNDIETPAKGEYRDPKYNNQNTWTKYDQIVDLSQEYGLGLIVRLDFPPEWARSTGNPAAASVQDYPPANFEDYGDFVYAVVSRYKGRVKYYQLWNEPNLAIEWGGNKPDAKAFVRLLQIGYTRAKEADPDAVILAPALAPTLLPSGSPEGIDDLTFLQQMYDAGAKDYFDIMSANNYGLWTSAGDRLAAADQTNFSRPELLREIMVRNGDGGKSIWISETGWPALPPDYEARCLRLLGELATTLPHADKSECSAPPIYGNVPPQQQAAWTVQAFERVQQEWPWLGVMNLWHLRLVHDVNQYQQRYYFGILSDKFVPLPTYKAVKALATGPAIIERGYYQEYDWAIYYGDAPPAKTAAGSQLPDGRRGWIGGGWYAVKDTRAVLGALMQSDKRGDSFSFSWRGTDLDLVVATGPQSGIAQVEIDGTRAYATELPGGTINLYSPTPAYRVRIPVARGLPDTVHTIRVVSIDRDSHSGGYRISLDGVVVNRQLSTIRGEAFALTIILLGGLLILTLFVRRRVRRT